MICRGTYRVYNHAILSGGTVNIYCSKFQISQHMIQCDDRVAITPRIWIRGYILPVHPLWHLNSSPSIAVYMRLWTGSALFQVRFVACLAPSHYLKQCWFTVNLLPGNIFQWNTNWNSSIFIQENALENVCEKGTILSRPRWVSKRMLDAQTAPISHHLVRLPLGKPRLRWHQRDKHMWHVITRDT